MRVLSHRGWWETLSEKNTVSAFTRSFEAGFGVETDLRDAAGVLLVSHDPPVGGELQFVEFLGLARPNDAPLAINIKSDGLAIQVAEVLKHHANVDAFVFDMSVPDMRSYFAAGVPVFTRVSEVEQTPVWLNESAGVWLDAFDSEWYSSEVIQGFVDLGKRVCVVSPELHGRPHRSTWESLLEFRRTSDVLLCTDYPDDAANFFGGGAL